MLLKIMPLFQCTYGTSPTSRACTCRIHAPTTTSMLMEVTKKKKIKLYLATCLCYKSSWNPCMFLIKLLPHASTFYLLHLKPDCGAAHLPGASLGAMHLAHTAHSTMNEVINILKLTIVNRKRVWYYQEHDVIKTKLFQIHGRRLCTWV